MKKHHINTIYLLASLLGFLSCTDTITNKAVVSYDAIPQGIALTTLNTQGIFVAADQMLVPNEKGIIASIKLELPNFEKGVYYRPFSAKVASGNRVEPIWFSAISDLSLYKKKKPRMDGHTGSRRTIARKSDAGSLF